MSNQVLFVGAGYANLSVLKNWKKNTPKDTEWTLISPSRYKYFPEMTGLYMEDQYSLEDIRVDLAEFCHRNGGRFLEEKVTAVDRDRKTVLTESGKSLSYDLLSAGMGLRQETGTVPGVRDHALFLNPHEEIPMTAASMQYTEYPVVAGGGAFGVEFALSLQAWRRANRKKTPVTLITSGPVLPEENKDVRDNVRDLLDERGLLLYENMPVERIDADVIYAGSRVLPYGQVLWLDGAKPPLIFDYADLPVDDKGYLLLSSTLQTVGSPDIFGSGAGTVLQEEVNTSKDSITAFQEAKVLEENLDRMLRGKTKLKTFKPPKKESLVLNMGHRTGFYRRGSKTYISRQAWREKKKLDKYIMKEIRS
ncbi:NAD(P)/FAD-dependent oxidoreductase [Salibacterium halotolerans]|uniref:NADH dehydrogenase, FAD-containing subunit n=1 Tax=Salibacterium halotolerans TaxID=1884432 RepID=A0A1I5U0D6_9BACI|nr:FAD-dependent oxidoreductase [Salibacterium halotolerans]SFP88641.1 NADH dehydrogenase, FAD-containing subunit [Salibacterium halotolerans]